MAFTLAPLPYGSDELSPMISPETIDFHYRKHHQAYVDNLNNLVKNTEWEAFSLEEIIHKTTGPIFNQAAQVWNHDFYWQSLSPIGGGEPGPKLAALLVASFGSIDGFKDAFTQAALKQFGSGWAWLVKKKNGTLAVVTTSNAGTPLTTEDVPLLTCDVWEHAYYIDYRNRRAEYLKNFWRLVHWDFAESRL